MKIAAAVVIVWFVALAGIQAYHSGVKQGRIEMTSMVNAARARAYDTGNRVGHAEGFQACEDQF